MKTAKRWLARGVVSVWYLGVGAAVLAVAGVTVGMVVILLFLMGMSVYQQAAVVLEDGFSSDLVNWNLVYAVVGLSLWMVLSDWAFKEVKRNKEERESGGGSSP